MRAPPPPESRCRIQGARRRARPRASACLGGHRRRSAAAGPPAPGHPAARGGGPPAAAVPGKSVSGTVTLADGLKGKVGPTDTLFIYARAATGSRMPLAILRGGAGELPKAFELDDSMGMAPNVKLSTTPSVVIEARLTKTGGAVAHPATCWAPARPWRRGRRVWRS